MYIVLNSAIYERPLPAPTKDHQHQEQESWTRAARADLIFNSTPHCQVFPSSLHLLEKKGSRYGETCQSPDKKAYIILHKILFYDSTWSPAQLWTGEGSEVEHPGWEGEGKGEKGWRELPASELHTISIKNKTTIFLRLGERARAREPFCAISRLRAGWPYCYGEVNWKLFFKNKFRFISLKSSKNDN